MSNKNFNALEFLHEKFKYPFPILKNPLANQLQEITDHQWIDGEYLSLYKDNPELRKKYKKTKTAHIAAHFFPTASEERFRPICRLMLWAFLNDDLYEESEPNNIEYVRNQSIAILNGEIKPSRLTIPLGGMLVSSRQELLEFMPQEFILRLSQTINKYFIGLEKELMYKKSKKFPTIAECIAFRENTVCLYPFLQLITVDLDVVFPSEIHEHPVIQRLQALTCRMSIFFNEVQSVVKDEATESIYYNTVKVIQNELRISLEEACQESLRLHNEDLEEFITLQASLPDFGIWHDAVVNWVHYMSLVLSGWKNISANLDRYNGMAFPTAVELQKKLREIDSITLEK